MRACPKKRTTWTYSSGRLELRKGQFTQTKDVFTHASVWVEKQHINNARNANIREKENSPSSKIYASEMCQASAESSHHLYR